MSMLPYQTKITQIHSVERLSVALKREMLDYPFPSMTTVMGKTIKHAFIITPRPEHEDAPVLTQYLDLEGKNAPNLVIDARKYMTYDHRSDTYRLTTENDYSFLCNRVILNLVAMREGMGALNRFGDLPCRVFSRWITLTLSQRYNLPVEHQLNLLVLTAYYYYALINPALVETPEKRVDLAGVISRVTGVPSPNVVTISDAITEMPTTAEGYCKLISERSGSLRFERFGYIDLFNFMAGSWIGLNSRETVGVALEHPPTFIAMIYASITERSFRKARFVDRVNTDGRRPELAQFAQMVNRIIIDELSD